MYVIVICRRNNKSFSASPGRFRVRFFSARQIIPSRVGPVIKLFSNESRKGTSSPGRVQSRTATLVKEPPCLEGEIEMDSDRVFRALAISLLVLSRCGYRLSNCLLYTAVQIGSDTWTLTLSLLHHPWTECSSKSEFGSRQSCVPGTLGAITLLLPKKSLVDLALASSVIVGHMLVDSNCNINNHNNTEENEG